jgi:peptide/nickel transport system substrate-binding protein
MFMAPFPNPEWTRTPLGDEIDCTHVSNTSKKGERGVMNPFKIMGLAVAALFAAYVPAFAATPADTVVIADKIDDIVSLDPAESFEFSGNDALNNVYDRLIEIDPATMKLKPGLAESWSVADDGKTYTFKIRQGVKFHSGNPVTAEDCAWSLQRAVKLNKTPAFILTQFGFTPQNVDQMIKANGDAELQITTDKSYAPSFFYNILTAIVASVVDKKEALSHEENGDMGYNWLKTHSAASGPFMLRAWKPNDSLVLEKPEGFDYFNGKVAMRRIYVRHVPESSAQRLLLEKGDIDIARKLTPGDVEAVSKSPDIKIKEEVRGRIFYVAGNQKVEALAKPKVMEAIKYAIDYDGMVNSFLKGQMKVHQSFLPEGFLGAIDDNPYKLDIDKAKALLKEAGYPDGLDLTLWVRNDQQRLDMAQSIQATLGQAGIKITLKTGTGSEILGDFRARKQQLILEAWGPDYPDPQTNASTFASNANNSDEAKLTGVLAWRTAWDAKETTPMVEAAVVEKDSDKRAKMYEDMQRKMQKEAPFAWMFQEVAQTAIRKNVNGFGAGGALSSAFYWPVTKE